MREFSEFISILAILFIAFCFGMIAEQTRAQWALASEFRPAKVGWWRADARPKYRMRVHKQWVEIHPDPL